MGAGTTKKAWLNKNYLLIALAPAAFFLISQLLLEYVVQPFDLLPERLAEFDVHKEGAARVSMLAALLLFIGAALAALLFFFYTLRMLDRPSVRRTIVAFLALAGVAMLVGYLTQGREPLDHVGKTLACIAAGYDREQSVSARADELARLKAPPAPATGGTPPRSPPTPPVQAAGVAVEHLANGENCAHERFNRIRLLGAGQFYGLVLAFSGLIFGAICCLATMPSTAGAAGADDAELRHWEKQSEWLNTYLYLAALLLGTTLLFINAYLRMPAFVLTETASYDAHVAALVSYYGFAFTVFLAAFYIPVATILSNKVRALKPAAPGESRLPAAFKGPLQILKIVLGLASTALAGVIPGLLGLIA